MAAVISFSIPSQLPTHCVAICSDDTFIVDFAIEHEAEGRKEHIVIDVYNLPSEERSEFVSLFNRALFHASQRDEEERAAIERQITAIPAEMQIEASCPVCTIAFMVCVVAAMIFLIIRTAT